MHEWFEEPIIINDDKFNNTTELTLWWLDKYLGKEMYDSLTLRKYRDFRKDDAVKKEMYKKLIQNKYNILYVIDDRQQVVDMWRDDLGLTTLQVGKGDF